MKSLETKEWAVFGFSDVFIIRKGFYNKKPNNNGSGTIPFLGAVDSNNGITRFLTLNEIEMSTRTGAEPNEPLDRKLFPGHAIAVTNNGSVGHAYYQETSFTSSHDVNPLYLKDHEMNQYEAEFFIKAIEKQGELFQYARKWRPIRMVKSKILLPVTDAGEPDYKYMTEYVQQQEDNLLSKYFGYVTKRLSDLGDVIQIPSLDDKKWIPFVLGNLAEIRSGRDIYADERIDGNTPYITSGTANNGIGYFVSNDNDSRLKNAISVNRNGAVGQAFFHPYSALYGNDCRQVILHDCRNIWVQLFFTQIISKQKSAFSYSRKLGTVRLKNLHIMLPVDNTNKPDYEYMEQYVKNMMISKYRQYLAYTEKR